MIQKKCFRIILTALTILIFAENVYSENCPELNFPVGDRVQITKKEKREILIPNDGREGETLKGKTVFKILSLEEKSAEEVYSFWIDVYDAIKKQNLALESKVMGDQKRVENFLKSMEALTENEKQVLISERKLEKNLKKLVGLSFVVKNTPLCFVAPEKILNN